MFTLAGIGLERSIFRWGLRRFIKRVYDKISTSASNKELTVLYNADRELGTGVNPLVVEDKELGETYVINNAWIRKYPTVTRGQAPNLMEWTFRGDFMTPAIV